MVSVTTGNYNAQPGDEVSVDKTSFEFTYVFLPSNPPVDTTVKVTENTDPSSYQCSESNPDDCWPAGVGVQSVDAQQGVQIDGSMTLALAGAGQQVLFTWNGSSWNATFLN
jgi:hypothetical protein